MDNLGNNENQNPKSHQRIGYNTAFKNNIQFKNNISIKNKKMAPRTPLKSKINIMNTNPQPSDIKDDKCLKYPLLKSTSFSNMNNNNKFQNTFNNNNICIEEKYNENAFEDEIDDFMHMNENKIYINNEEENGKLSPLTKPRFNGEILNDINPFKGNNNFILSCHYDDNGKKEYDDYFNSPDENDLIDSDN